MSRIRNVKPEFFRHEGLQDLERTNAGKYPMFVFEGLWTKCDRQGVFEWKPRLLKLDILPFLDFDMEETMSILSDNGYIRKYKVEDKDYGIIPTFNKHQFISKAEKDNVNVFPLPKDGCETVDKPLGNGSETVGKHRNSEFGILNTENGITDLSATTEKTPEVAEAAPPVVETPLPASKPQKPAGKPAKTPLREREPENDYERVEKVYLHNWDSLFKQGKVKTENPVVNWTQARVLLKKHFERLKPDDITGALDRGLNDSFIMQGGYSLAVMLSATVLNRLINTSGGSSGPAPPRSLQEKKPLRGLDKW
ncbi:MAG: hypothetical protein Pg6C_16680 [Treponemataceae bacterium]|nr:MAG: hypothetical protein Pg6C_16680 [Treponemataceae bacterium]